MKKQEKVMAWLILLIFLGMIATALQSDEVDDLCITDNRLLKRVSGTWTCYDETEIANNPFNQELNTTDNPTFNNVTINTINVTGKLKGENNTKFGGWKVIPIDVGESDCLEACASEGRACVMGLDVGNNWVFQECDYGTYSVGDTCLCTGTQ